MTIRVVDNKKLDMTDDEYGLYQRICQSYTTVSNKGEDMFIDLFESNEEGIITFLKPPSKRHTSLEVFLFLMAVMQHQHLRIMRQEVSDALAELKGELKKKKTAK